MDMIELMKHIRIFPAIAALSFLIACNGAKTEEENNSAFENPSDSPLEGKISTVNWIFRSGTAKPVHGDANRYAISLYESMPSGDICNFHPTANENSILFSIPKSTGNYVLGLNSGQTLTFYDASSEEKNLIATKGSIVLSAVTGTTVSGKLKVERDQNTFADGQFLVTVCP